MPGVPRSLASLVRLASTSARACCRAPSARLRSAMTALALRTMRTYSFSGASNVTPSDPACSCKGNEQAHD